MTREMTPEAVSAFAECSSFYRDTILPPNIFNLNGSNSPPLAANDLTRIGFDTSRLAARFFILYKVGQLFREPTLCDATINFGGFAASHRYLIISANARSLGALSKNPEWGLCTWNPGSIFKVICIASIDGFSQITLLEIPESLRKEFTSARFSEMEIRFASQSVSQYFTKALLSDPLPEQQSSSWLERLKNPLGIDDDGVFFESWSDG
jgi:hypothetical protein